MRIVGRLLVTLLALIGLGTILAVVTAAFALRSLLPQYEPLPARMMLVADWRETIGEVAGAPNPLDFRLPRTLTVSETVLALDRAAVDPRVAGLVVRLAETSNGLALTQELRDAVQHVAAAGKLTVAYADTFGELGSGNEGYYLASAFKTVHLSPVGLVGLTGLAAQMPFVRSLLDRLGIGFEVIRRAEYKSALESLTESEISSANRAQTEALLDTLQGQLVGGIATGRGLAPERVERLLDRGPITALEALADGLVDHLSQPEDALDLARREVGRDARPVELADYAAHEPDPPAGAAEVALIQAAGPIRRGEHGIGEEIAADDLAALLHDVAKDRDVKAVLLRLDSGGGSAVASDTVARALRKVRHADKPVVVSMGNAAASGGYWIAAEASRIVAQPATLTGSIGVLAGKPDLAGVWDRLDVHWAEITRGAHAGMWSLNRPYTPEERARVEAIVGSLYESFTERVAHGRHLPLARVQEIAKGRVWAGETAAGLGLVDRLGGLDAALDEIRRELMLPADAPLAIKLESGGGEPWRALLRWLRPESTIRSALAAWLQALRGGLLTLEPPILVR